MISKRQNLAPPRVNVLQAMRDQIVAGHRVAGSRLIERDLCAEFGVSRTAVRESLIRLADLGLVSLVPDAGATVERISPEQVLDAYFYRAAIEPAAAEQCASRMNREQIDRLLEAAGQFASEYAAACSGKPHQLLQLEDAFHGMVIEGSANAFFRRGWEVARMHLFRGIQAHPDSLLNEKSRKLIVNDHIAIAHAIRDGDAPRAFDAMKQHLHRGRAQMVERLRSVRAAQVGQP